jgi:hypothetical protein
MTGPTLPELWRLAAQHHDALKGFVIARARDWHDAAIRRTALQGIAVLAAMVRRLLHLLALGVPLAPLRPRMALPALPRAPSPRRLYRFRLTERVRERPRRAPNPQAVPDPPELSRALLLERLAAIADAYRRRGAIARRLARRVRGRRAPLKAPPVAAPLWPRLPAGFRNMLEHLGQRLAGADTS